MRARIYIGAMLTALALAQTACADDGGDGDSPDSPASATTTVESAATKARDLNLTKLKVADDNVRTTGARRGYLYLCNQPNGQGGAQAEGPWIDGSRWDYTEKLLVDGSVDWSQATYSQSVSGSTRTLRGNGLPTSHTTGTYPVSQDDDVYQYDRNPNSIKSQEVEFELPTNPRKASSPQCIRGGQVGVLDTGVALFHAVDATGRDAAAHEVQDRCDGHPQISGVYHYHALPRCLKTGSKRSHSKRIGWAMDGYPIYGPRGEGGEYMRNSRLDACHGHSHTVKVDGRKQSLYHYHATMEFPYTVGCFRAEQRGTDSGGEGGGPPSMGAPPAMGGPPPAY